MASWFSQTEAPLAGADREGRGWVVSGAWALQGRPLQLAARYGESDPNQNDATDPTTEVGAGVTIFHRGHEVQSRVQLQRFDRPLGMGRLKTTLLTVETQILIGG
jgi:hypothetical protein